jgi:hypothetical protein
MCSILLPKVLCALCFIMFFLSFAISFLMKVFWPERFVTQDNKMTIQNPSDALIWLSMIFWLSMWCFRSMFDGWLL